MKHLISIGEAKVEYGAPIIEVKIDKKAKLHIDQGLVTSDEVEKYINQVAFSGAEEFLEKYKDSPKILELSVILVGILFCFYGGWQN
jgi:molecular chaperone HtpG